MAVTAADLILYNSANTPEDDSSTAGGAWNNLSKVLNTDIQDITLNDTGLLEVVSDDAGDTVQTLTITGRSTAGSVVTEDFSLNGTSPQTGSQVFERVLKCNLDQFTTGTITISSVESSSGLGTMEGSTDAPGSSGVTELRRPFYAWTANASGGATKVGYEKVFLGNTNTTTALLSATVTLTGDATSYTGIDFKTSDAVDESESVANRVTEPSNTSGNWDNFEKPVPGIDLQPGGRIGLWIRNTLPAGTNPGNSNITFQIDGTSA